MENMSRKKRVRVDSDELEYNSPEVKKLREDLLDDLNDESEFCTTSHDFDSFMKSFEDEIKAKETEVVDLTADSDESQPELGYLLEASDDELGLPPASSTAPAPAPAKTVGSESEIELIRSELWEVEERIPNYDSFELGMTDLVDYNEYVALDGLFDHSDLGFGSPDFLWRPETLPAN